MLKGALGLLIALACAAATAGCDDLQRMDKTAILWTQVPSKACVESSLQTLRWVERVSTTDASWATTVLVVPKAGALEFDVVLQPERQPSDFVGRIRLSWFRMNQKLSVDEMRTLRSNMESAYLAIRSHCPGLPEPAALQEVCDACPK